MVGTGSVGYGGALRGEVRVVGSSFYEWTIQCSSIGVDGHGTAGLASALCGVAWNGLELLISG